MGCKRGCKSGCGCEVERAACSERVSVSVSVCGCEWARGSQMLSLEDRQDSGRGGWWSWHLTGARSPRPANGRPVPNKAERVVASLSPSFSVPLCPSPLCLPSLFIA